MAPPYVCQTTNCSRRGIPSRLRVCPACAGNSKDLPINPIAELLTMRRCCQTCGGDDLRTVEFCADCGEPTEKVQPNIDRGPFVCLHCMEDHHQKCIGAACRCSCEGPHPLSPAPYESEARKIAITMCCSCGSREHAEQAIMALIERVQSEAAAKNR